MDIQKQIDIANLHHAYVLEDSAESFEALQALLKNEYRDAEVHVREFDLLGIEDSRELIALASMRSLGNQLFIYRAQSWSREAQNALLKLFEEPPPHTHFFFCIRGVCDVLPTLRSRVWIIDQENRERGGISGKDFVRKTAAQRMALLDVIIKEKDIAGASTLLQEVEKELHEKLQARNVTEALEHIISVRKVLSDKGVSLKTLLESVALTTPQLS